MLCIAGSLAGVVNQPRNHKPFQCTTETSLHQNFRRPVFMRVVLEQKMSNKLTRYIRNSVPGPLQNTTYIHPFQQNGSRSKFGPQVSISFQFIHILAQLRHVLACWLVAAAGLKLESSQRILNTDRRRKRTDPAKLLLPRFQILILFRPCLDVNFFWISLP